jgi:hypothetical protein
MTTKLRRVFIACIIFATVLGANSLFPANANAAEGEFYLQVSPSPLVTTLKPGQQSTLDLKVRNAGTETEKLTITPRSFKVNNDGKVEFNDTQAPEVAEWINFREKDFSVEPGQWFDQQVTIDVPKDAGFSYSFALLITRQKAETPNVDKGQELKGQVAVFALLNIDRPGAVRELQLESLKTEAGIYEYLPSKLDLRLKNTGNTIVRPSGNVFIQRGSQDTEPIDTLAVNQAGGYILPGTVRSLAVDWDNGFPVVKKDTQQSPTREYVDWDWSNLSNIRFGHYTAKAVVIYNDGQRDIPLMAEVGFWVIPWKLLLGVLVILALLAFGVWSVVRQIMRLSRRGSKRSVRLRR